MTEDQWIKLCAKVDSSAIAELSIVLFTEDTTIAKWNNLSMIQYYTSTQLWIDANWNYVSAFPTTLFLHSFWPDFGICSECSAFGGKITWSEKSTPTIEKVLFDISEAEMLEIPNPRTDGLLPFVAERIKISNSIQEQRGHYSKFAIARGPLSIAANLVGTSELLNALLMSVANSHALLRKISVFIIRWLQYQKELSPSIEGIILIDDTVGLVDDRECKEYVVPYLKMIYNSFDSKLNILQNSKYGLVCAPYLEDIGVDLFRFSRDHTITEMQKAVGNSVFLTRSPEREIIAN